MKSRKPSKSDLAALNKNARVVSMRFPAGEGRPRMTVPDQSRSRRDRRRKGKG
ncbi:MAG: hypothetical protein M3Q49_00970 [Actinomycetota bacterium]|nr:hypothetical protein [Actinomycetota bacterium]